VWDPAVVAAASAVARGGARADSKNELSIIGDMFFLNKKFGLGGDRCAPPLTGSSIRA
jgi:hypothetical protein